MSEKKAYPLRINAEVLAAAQRWADDELRSLNAQIEYVLRDALRNAGRLKASATAPGNSNDESRTDESGTSENTSKIKPASGETP